MTTKIVSCFVVVDSIHVVEKSLVPNQPGETNYDSHIQKMSNSFLMDILRHLRRLAPGYGPGPVKTLYNWSSHKRLLTFTGYTKLGLSVVCVCATPTRSLELGEGSLKNNIQMVEDFVEHIHAKFTRFTSAQIESSASAGGGEDESKYPGQEQDNKQKSSIAILQFREEFQDILQEEMEEKNQLFAGKAENRETPGCCGRCSSYCAECVSGFSFLDCLSAGGMFLLGIGYILLGLIAVVTIFPALFFCVYICRKNGNCYFDCCNDCDCTCHSSQEIQRTSTDKAIMTELEKRHEQSSNTCKVVLFGPSYAGKSTICKQLRALYGDGFSNEDRKDYIATIHANVVGGMQALLHHVDAQDEKSEDSYDSDNPEAVRQIRDLEDGVTLTLIAAKHIKTLWEDPKIQEAFKNRRNFDASEHLQYFVEERLTDLVESDYIPTLEDIIRARHSNSGRAISEEIFQLDFVNIQIIDVGGQLNARRKWVHSFEGVTALIFVASVADYDKIMKDTGQSNWIETLDFFDDLVNMKWFRNTYIHVFLNKTDTLQEKLKTTPINEFLPDCKSNEFETVIKHLQNNIKERIRRGNEISFHCTNALDNQSIDRAFSNVKQVVRRHRLSQAGFMGGGFSIGQSSSSIQKNGKQLSRKNSQEAGRSNVELQIADRHHSKQPTDAPSGPTIPSPTQSVEDGILDEDQMEQSVSRQQLLSSEDDFLEEYDPTTEWKEDDEPEPDVGDGSDVDDEPVDEDGPAVADKLSVFNDEEDETFSEDVIFTRSPGADDSDDVFLDSPNMFGADGDIFTDEEEPVDIRDDDDDDDEYDDEYDDDEYKDDNEDDDDDEYKDDNEDDDDDEYTDDDEYDDDDEYEDDDANEDENEDEDENEEPTLEDDDVLVRAVNILGESTKMLIPPISKHVFEDDPIIEDDIDDTFDSKTPIINAVDKDGDVSMSKMQLNTVKSMKKDKKKKSRRKLSLKSKRKKKRKKPKIDNIFADMENVFNGLAALLLRFECWSTDDADRHGRAYQGPIPKLLSIIFWNGPLLFLVYCFVSSFTLTIILPTCFIVLILRTSKIERKVERFAVRQKVLTHETKQEKSLRLISLLMRAIPMLTLLVGFPIISIYLIIPKYGATRSVVNATVGTHLIIIVTLQILGSYRSYKSYVARKKEEKEAKLERFRQEEISLAQAINESLPEVADEELLQERSAETVIVVDESSLEKIGFPAAYEQIDGGNQMPPPEPKFQMHKFGNWLAVVTLLVEALQFATFAIQKLNESETDEQGSGSTLGFIDENLLPAVFVTFENVFSAEDIHRVYTYATFAICSALILAFLFQFLREVRRFGILKLRKLDTKSANDCFFSSFIGSIVYGHGDLTGVSSTISAIVVILSDTLFIITTEKLLLLLTCMYPKDSPPHLTINPRVLCWQGEHQVIAVIALVFFSFYLPLATMIAPMLAEASSIAADDADEHSFRRFKRKDIRYVQPFLSVVTVFKCIMLVAVSFFSQASALVIVSVSFLTSLALSLITYIWHITTQPKPDLDQAATPGKEQPVIDELRKAEPAGLGFAAIFRCLAFVSGIWGAICATLASGMAGQEIQDLLKGDAKYVVLLIGWLFLGFYGTLWYRRWSQEYQSTVQMLWQLSLPETFEMAHATDEGPWGRQMPDISKTWSDTNWKYARTEKSTALTILSHTPLVQKDSGAQKK